MATTKKKTSKKSAANTAPPQNVKQYEENTEVVEPDTPAEEKVRYQFEPHDGVELKIFPNQFKTVFLLKNVRLKDENIFTPAEKDDPDDENEKRKYRIAVGIPKAGNEHVLKQLGKLLVAYEKKHNVNLGLAKAKSREMFALALKSTCLHDGDNLSEKGDYMGQPRMEGFFYITASTQYQPKVYAKSEDGKYRRIRDVSEGCHRGAIISVILSLWHSEKENYRGIYANFEKPIDERHPDSVKFGGEAASLDEVGEALGYEFEDDGDDEMETQCGPRPSFPGANRSAGALPGPQKVSDMDLDDFDDDIPFAFAGYVQKGKRNLLHSMPVVAW